MVNISAGGFLKTSKFLHTGFYSIHFSKYITKITSKVPAQYTDTLFNGKSRLGRNVDRSLNDHGMYFSELSSSPCPDRNLIKPGRIKLSHTHEQFIKSKHRKSQPWMDFDDFFFFVYSLVVVSIEKIYQTLKTVFHRLSSNFKNTPLRVELSTLFSKWNSDLDKVKWMTKRSQAKLLRKMNFRVPQRESNPWPSRIIYFSE